MPNASARNWFGAASAKALAELRGEVARLADELATMRADGQRDAEALRHDLAVLDERFDGYASSDAVAELRGRIESDGVATEELRLRLAGLADQLKWESEDLRKALAAIAERAERKH